MPAQEGEEPPLLPPWKPTYDLQRSLAAMPCNESGWSDPAVFGEMGLVTFDMNNAADVWEAGTPQNICGLSSSAENIVRFVPRKFGTSTDTCFPQEIC